MVIALAGRRVDAPAAETRRFPPENVEIVRARIRDELVSRGAKAVVCSAACGSDLLALAEAGALGIRRRVVLPFERQRFKQSSVIDRPGEWGDLFDRVLDAVAARGDVITLSLEGVNDDAAYRAANDAILEQACDLAAASGDRACALIVWDGDSRGEGDLTEAFSRSAAARGFPVSTVLTV